jgi:signal transduction histidine kinase
MTVCRRFDDIPPTLRTHLTPDLEGMLEINADGLNYHVAAARLPSSDQMIYLLYDVGALELSEQSEQVTDLVLLGIGLAILIAGWFLAHSMAKRILQPVSRLAESVQALSPEDENPRLAAYEASDEISTLAATIDGQIERIASLTRREREFTSHASHELRTPISVIKGAVEILRGRTDKWNEHEAAPLARIERSVADIEILIDTFLLLARQDIETVPNEPCDLPHIIEEVAAAHIHLLERKPVEVDINPGRPEPVFAPASVVSIAVGNLIRNAFQYTLKGRVTITTAVDRIIVSDTGPGLGHSGGGYGLGLTIVRRLCERMNWTFEISNIPAGGTYAELIFRSDAAEPAPAKE